MFNAANKKHRYSYPGTIYLVHVAAAIYLVITLLSQYILKRMTCARHVLSGGPANV